MIYEGVKQSDKLILMKLTSRGRAKTLFDTVSKYVTLANNPKRMTWILSLDEDDKTIQEYYKLMDLIPVIICTNPPSNKIAAINSNVPSDGWDILLNISDDQIPIKKGYDDVIRNTMPDSLDGSLWFSDGRQPRINTQEIIGNTYYKRFGYIYNPIYKSFFCDNEATEEAKKLGKLIRSPQCLIRHDHPGWDRKSHIKFDELYHKNDTYWKEDEATFKARFK